MIYVGEHDGVYSSEIYNAWRAFLCGKKPTQAIDAFAYNLETELDLLQQEITQRTYCHGTYQTVIVREKKRRHLAVASVRDRVIHRFVYDKLVDVFDNTFDPDVWSCRKGKGLHACLTRAQAVIRKYPQAYMWRMDIEKFFDNVDHATLRSCLKRRVHDQQVTWLTYETIDSYQHHVNNERNAGIPIGNLTSQIFANIYLHEFDRYVRHTLKPLAYIRYGDDAVVWCQTRQQAKQMRRRAHEFLAETLYLAVNPKNEVVVPARAGLHFLGHVITRSYVVVDRHTTKSVLGKSNSQSIASYKSLLLAATPRQQLDWLLVDEMDDVGIIW